MYCEKELIKTIRSRRRLTLRKNPTVVANHLREHEDLWTKDDWVYLVRISTEDNTICLKGWKEVLELYYDLFGSYHVIRSVYRDEKLFPLAIFYLDLLEDNSINDLPWSPKIFERVNLCKADIEGLVHKLADLIYVSIESLNSVEYRSLSFIRTFLEKEGVKAPYPILDKSELDDIYLRNTAERVKARFVALVNNGYLICRFLKRIDFDLVEWGNILKAHCRVGRNILYFVCLCSNKDLGFEYLRMIFDGEYVKDLHKTHCTKGKKVVVKGRWVPNFSYHEKLRTRYGSKYLELIYK